MTGLQMLLKQLGLDPEKVQSTYQSISTQLPMFLNALGAKVEDMHQRIRVIEANQRLIMEKLEIPINAITATAAGTATNDSHVNGAAAAG